MNVYIQVSVGIGANPNMLVSSAYEMSNSAYIYTRCQKTENPRRVLLSPCCCIATWN